jgi:hypothetical protein
MTRRIDRAVLEDLFADAFDVMNWARRLGMKRDQQQEEVISAYLKTLNAAGVEVSTEPTK